MTEPIRIVSWNIDKQDDPWLELDEMAQRGEADAALLQEAGTPPGKLVHLVPDDDDTFWGRHLYDRWPLVVQLSDRVKVERFRESPPISDLGDADIGASGIGTMAAARVTPQDPPGEPFIAVSMYARWMRSHPSTGNRPGIHCDVSAHRILSDLSAFIDHADSRRHRILAAGDLNLCYTTTKCTPWFDREWTVWKRFDALGLEFLGPQLPNGRAAATSQPGVPADTLNVPTYHTRRQSPAEANRQLDYAFASRGFHERVSVRALNGIDEWGASDHCRLLIEVGEWSAEDRERSGTTG